MVFIKQKILQKKNKVKEYKMTEREHYEKFDNLSEKELDKKIINKYMLEMML